MTPIKFFSFVGFSLLLLFQNQSPFTNTELSSFYSETLDETIEFIIFTPPGYETSTERYPVLYFLHGRSGNHFLYWGAITQLVPEAKGDAGAWISKLIEEGEIPPIIIVTPDDADGQWGEINEKMITEELIHHIDTNWRTIPNRTGRSIEGFSMGGMGASRYSAKFPDIYCSSIIMGAPYSDELIPDWENNKDKVLENELQIRLVVGTEDPQLDSMTFLDENLIALKIPHQFETLPGVGHNVGEIYNQVGVEGLQFHAECFQNTKPVYKYPIYIPNAIKRYFPF
jgi:enterochelin esterase-like enzyme